MTPVGGPVGGSTAVTVLGNAFTGTTKVTFGTKSAGSSYTVVSNTKITVTSPADTAGMVNVTVTTPGGHQPDQRR